MPRGIELTFYERQKIEVYLRLKKKKTFIARKLGRDYSVIKREINRNSGEQTPYIAIEAQHYAQRRKKNTNKRNLEKCGNEELRKFVETAIRDGISPEQIAGRLKEMTPNEVKKCRNRTVSYESIYDYIYNGQGRFGGLFKKLRRKHKVRVRKFSRKPRKKLKIKERVSIHERPKIVLGKSRFGDWETDVMEFTGKSILAVQYERKSQLCRLHKCPDKTAVSFEEALQLSIESLPAYAWQTITRDNGGENVLHHQTEVQSYFCDPYCSWQKGGVENLNGLIREYFPKKTSLDNITEREIYEVQEKLNNRPRKANHFLTPNEVANYEIKKGH